MDHSEHGNAHGNGHGTLVERAGQTVVGRRREVELLVAALAASRHVVLEGPPGTGKSSMLRAVAHELGVGFELVEGNADLTPARLVGHFDPAVVIADGYTPDAFVDGPLVAALRGGGLLYLEELNRIPEETLNVLVTVMSEREIIVPRLGRVVAAPGFRFVAAMNPFDAIGTARISAAISFMLLAVTSTRRRAAASGAGQDCACNLDCAWAFAVEETIAAASAADNPTAWRVARIIRAIVSRLVRRPARHRPRPVRTCNWRCKIRRSPRSGRSRPCGRDHPARSS